VKTGVRETGRAKTGKEKGIAKEKKRCLGVGRSGGGSLKKELETKTSKKSS